MVEIPGDRSLRLLDQHKDDASLSVAGLYDKFLEQSNEKRNGHFFYNHSFFMGCLLAFIVNPQVVNVERIGMTPVQDLDDSWGLKQLKIELMPNPETLNIESFVRRVRNSISHGRLCEKHDDGLWLVFEDARSHKAVDFRVTIPINDLMTFCSRFNLWVIDRAKEEGIVF